MSWDRSGEVFHFYTFLICELWVYIISSKISNENRSNKISTPRISSPNSSPVLHASSVLSTLHALPLCSQQLRELCAGAEVRAEKVSGFAWAAGLHQA